MATVLCLNSGSNSIKFDVVVVESAATRAGEGRRLLTGTIDDIGKETKIELTRGGEKMPGERVSGGDVAAATEAIFEHLEKVAREELGHVDLIAVRTVHGGEVFREAVLFDDGVRKEIEAREELAPLHNANSLKIIGVVKKRRPNVPVAVAFDTAFHRTLPERAWRYPIDRGLAKKYGIRKFGFHGLSHRYMLEQYAHLNDVPCEETTIVTMHLESGCSLAAIERGQSVETSMGFTPLEGLMMGTRSGSVDPAILPFLMRHEGMSAEEALEVLEKRSGLKAISGVSLDTRVLRKREDADSRLAMEMFSYRVRMMTGAYLAVLGAGAQAVVFGGGIGENTPEVRRDVCAGLAGWGVELDEERNSSAVEGDQRLSTAASRLAIWSMHSDEALELAYECAKIHRA